VPPTGRRPWPRAAVPSRRRTEAEAADPPAHGAPPRGFSLFIGTAFAFSASYWTLLVLVPLYAAAAGYSLRGVGLLAAAPGLLQLWSRVPAGLLADWFGEVAVIRLCYLVVAVAGAVLADGRAGLAALVTAQVLNGLGRGLYWTASQAYVSRFRGDRAKLLGRLPGVTFAGALLALLGAGAFVRAAGFGAGFALVAALAALALAGSLALADRRPGRGGVPTAALARAGSLIRRPAIGLAGLCAFLSAIPNALTASFLPLYVVHLGFGGDVGTAVAALRNLGGLMGSALFAPALRRAGERNAFVGSLLALAGSFLLIPAGGGLWTCMAGVLVAGLAGAAANVQYLWLAADASAEAERASAMALTGLCWSLSMLLAPAAFGLVAGRFGFDAAFRAIGGLVLLAAATAGPLYARWRPGTHGGTPVPDRRPLGA
jgi:MFS family permease